MKNEMIKKIKIGAVTYDVDFFKDGTKNMYGACVYKHQKIFLSKEMLHDTASDTLLHEVLHAIWNESGLDHISDLNEENVVRTLSTWLRIVLTDNPELAKFIVNSKNYWHTKPTGDPEVDVIE